MVRRVCRGVDSGVCCGAGQVVDGGVKTFTELLPLFPNNQTILDTVAKALDHIEDRKKIMVSVSGGADSDILVDLFEKIGYEEGQVIYVFLNTGIEMEATLLHLDDLEAKYSIKIERLRSQVPVPLAVKRIGVPFLSKQVSMNISRLQAHGFNWSLHGNKPFDLLINLYPQCRSALRWLCNDWGKGSSFNIDRHAGLKDFLIQNPPPTISDQCCNLSKKNLSHEAEKVFLPDITVVGVRRAEGGKRATANRNCFTPAGKYAAQFRPIFYWSDADKAEYEAFCGVRHSDCYSVYGFTRTGCAGCPFGSGFEHELEALEQYEPKLYKAACNIFGPSYEYTRKYRIFKESWKREKRRGGQIDLFDNWEDLI